MNKRSFILLFSLTLSSTVAPAQTRLLYDAESANSWRAFGSDGVEAALLPAETDGKAGLRLELQFRAGSGYGGMVRNLDLSLPDNFTLTFRYRSNLPVNNFEIKFSDDSSGQNVWWVNRRSYQFSSDWQTVTIKRRHLEFAWGPAGGGVLKRVRRMEFVVAAGAGGQGFLEMSGVRIDAVASPPSPAPRLKIVASSTADGIDLTDALLDGNRFTGWTSGERGDRQWLKLDFGYVREFSGLRFHWDTTDYPVICRVLAQRQDSYDTLYASCTLNGRAVPLFLPESEAATLLLEFEKPNGGNGIRLCDINIFPVDSLRSVNDVIGMIAAENPRGMFPRYFRGEASYWTVAGVAGDENEALINEEGMFEAGPGGFSLEPFLRLDGRFLTWADSRNEQRLLEDYLPIPIVRRVGETWELGITLCASGTEDTSTLHARYRLVNRGTERLTGSLILAARPFQTNPSYQFLNRAGGAATVRSVEFAGDTLHVDSSIVLMFPRPRWVGAVKYDEGEIVSRLTAPCGWLRTSVHDPHRMASGAAEFPVDLEPGDSMDVTLAVLHRPSGICSRERPDFEKVLQETASFWRAKLNTIKIQLPAAARRIWNAVRSNLAYILINKDGPGFQPGSRSYERSWIRDGSLTSSALLKMGFHKEVSDFVRWYGSYQYPSGKVPCVVDRRGPDPVPEHDSHGEFIFACSEYFRFTKDTSFLVDMWPRILGAVNYLQSLRAERLTEKYRSGTPEERACYGLLTESISHEGYSSKPMHSYWDNFFALKGLKDAAFAARIIGDLTGKRELENLVSGFRSDLFASIRRTMENWHIDYIPGCVELGDFDPTSTTIALLPVGEQHTLPQAWLQQTFDKYWEWARRRSGGESPWENFTPYELRTLGAFVLLGHPDRAHELLDWFFRFQRPAGWNHWAEVVWHDERAPRFIGDMPHTWVGSDFINAVRTMFAIELAGDSLVLGAGIPREWLDEGVSIAGLPTTFGDVSIEVKRRGEVVLASIDGSLDPGQVTVLVPLQEFCREGGGIRLNGKRAIPRSGYLRISALPATIEFEYR